MTSGLARTSARSSCSLRWVQGHAASNRLPGQNSVIYCARFTNVVLLDQVIFRVKLWVVTPAELEAVMVKV